MISIQDSQLNDKLGHDVILFEGNGTREQTRIAVRTSHKLLGNPVDLA